MKISVKTLMGLEEVLAEEIRQIGGKEIEVGNRIVHFAGGQRELYRANLELRTAIRVLQPIFEFKVYDENHLYKTLRRKIDWTQYMSLQDTLAVDATVSSDNFSHSQYVALKTKDAIVDEFRRRHDGLRPNVDLNNPTLRVNIHISGLQCTVSIDSSGGSLHKRGYRIQQVTAPLSEVLAAGMLMLAGWKADRPFVDPMCGSGTLVIEAALMAYQIPPNLLREQYAFMNWKDFDADLWKEIVGTARQNIRTEEGPVIAGYDKDFGAVRRAQENAIYAHLEGKVSFQRQRLERLQPPAPNGMLITNPPYDERLESKDIMALYSMIGDALKQQFTGYDAWILSGNKEAIKNIGLKTSKRLHLNNGPIECKFHKYELYQGSKKVAG